MKDIFGRTVKGVVVSKREPKLQLEYEQPIKRLHKNGKTFFKAGRPGGRIQLDFDVDRLLMDGTTMVVHSKKHEKFGKVTVFIEAERK